MGESKVNHMTLPNIHNTVYSSIRTQARCELWQQLTPKVWRVDMASMNAILLTTRGRVVWQLMREIHDQEKAQQHE